MGDEDRLVAEALRGVRSPDGRIEERPTEMNEPRAKERERYYPASA
jgi:hypothetical protein